MREIKPESGHATDELREELEQERAARQRADQALRDLEALYHSLVNQMPAGMFRKDQQGRYVFVNSWFCRLKGVAPEQMLNKTPRELAASELAGQGVKEAAAARETRLANQGADHHERIMATGSPIEVDEEYPASNGRKLFLHAVKTPVFDAGGEIIGTQGVLFDITAFKEAEAQLAAAHRQLLEASRQAGMAEVATSVLHNVGNALNSINVSANLLGQFLDCSRVDYLARAAAMLSEHSSHLAEFLTTDPKGKTLPAYLGRLSETLSQERSEMRAELQSLLGHLEQVGRIVAMQQQLATAKGVREMVNLPELIEDALKMNAHSLQENNIEVARDFLPVTPVTLDRPKVLQVLVNLVTNAVHALAETAGPRKLRVGLSASPDSVSIKVGDNGCGIEGENLRRIFSQGFTTRKDGHGYGLHSGANAAKELGGSLTVQSDGPGKGATFTLTLPASTRPQKPGL